SPLIPDDDGNMDITQEILEAAAAYSQTLAVPRRRVTDDPQVRRGEELFVDAGCDRCHTPVLHTGNTHRFAALHDQEFAPFTDLLLHDMGEGLADGRPDFQASGSEWRTTPLWGVGLVARVMGAEAYLHDGRARSLEEAILWHGGEGERARERFRAIDASDREALLAFLRTL
ncbi:MAG TPA: di-heme oxidoredictase family protein, partial [Haliangium sp.]|nr:di-heme oxidoredictase family protein [Haliangium sp.]